MQVWDPGSPADDCSLGCAAVKLPPLCNGHTHEVELELFCSSDAGAEGGHHGADAGSRGGEAGPRGAAACSTSSGSDSCSQQGEPCGSVQLRCRFFSFEEALAQGAAADSEMGPPVVGIPGQASLAAGSPSSLPCTLCAAVAAATAATLLRSPLVLLLSPDLQHSALLVHCSAAAEYERRCSAHRAQCSGSPSFFGCCRSHWQPTGARCWTWQAWRRMPCSSPSHTLRTPPLTPRCVGAPATGMPFCVRSWCRAFFMSAGVASRQGTAGDGFPCRLSRLQRTAPDHTWLPCRPGCTGMSSRLLPAWPSAARSRASGG